MCVQPQTASRVTTAPAGRLKAARALWGEGRFEDASERAGLLAHEGFWTGLAAGDYDRDGHNDLYLAGMFSSAGSRIVPQAGFRPMEAGARKDTDIEALNAIKNVRAIRLDVTKADEIAAQEAREAALVEKTREAAQEAAAVQIGQCDRLICGLQGGIISVLLIGQGLIL